MTDRDDLLNMVRRLVLRVPYSERTAQLLDDADALLARCEDPINYQPLDDPDYGRDERRAP